MSLTATSRSIPGTLRQDVVIDGKHRLITDEPVEVGGDGSAPAPHELLPAALASCVSTTLVMYARRKGWELGDVRVDVNYDHRATPRRATSRSASAPTSAPSNSSCWRRSPPPARCAARSKPSSSSTSRSPTNLQNSGRGMSRVRPAMRASPDGNRGMRLYDYLR